MKKIKLVSFVLLTFCANVIFAAGKDGIGFFVFFPERQQERKASRWTLSDWMTTKKTIADQNLWLAKHSNKNPVDLTYTFEVKAPDLATHEVEFFLLWLGLSARYQTNWSKLSSYYSALPQDPMQKAGDAGLAIRLVGGNPQNTSLTIRALLEYSHVYGLLASVQGPYKSWVVEPQLQIYLAPWLGVRGAYRKRLEQINSTFTNTHLVGDSWWAGAFIEANSIRVEAVYESRKWQFKDVAGATDILNFNTNVLATRLRVFF